MASFNRVILMGHLTRDVDLRSTQGGTPVTEIGLAINQKKKDGDGKWVDDTPVFVEVTLWKRLAELASEHLEKGSPIHIEGRLRYDTWESDGQKRSKLRVIGERMQFVGTNGNGNGAPAGNLAEAEAADVPF